jgi:hypothetical protein
MVRIIEAPSRVPPTVAQQFFVIGSGLAGGLAGILLARNLTTVKDVSVSDVIIATIISAVFTLGAGIYLGRKAREGVV